MGGEGGGKREGGGQKGGGWKGGGSRGGGGRGRGDFDGDGKGYGGGGRGSKGYGGGGGDDYMFSENPDYGYAGYAPTVGYGGTLPGAWGWQAAPAQPMMQQFPLPPLWQEFKAEDGEPFYYNSRTGLTQWEKPKELDTSKTLTEALSDPKEFGSKGPARGGFERHQDGARDGQRGPRNDAIRGLDGGDGGKGDGGRGRGGGRDGGRDGGKGGRGGRGGRDGGKGRGGGGGSGKQDASEFGPPGCNLFVFHLPDDWTDDDLLEAFTPHGAVVSAKIMKELGTGRSRGFGFVSYEDRVSTATAIKKMQGYKILGKRLKVEFKKGEQGPEREGSDGKPLDLGLDGPDEAKGSYPDDERLIGYLRAISAKNVVQSLKESEGRGGTGDPGEGPDDD